MSESRPQRSLSLISLVIILLAVVVSVLLLLYKQQVIDNVRAWQFTPSSRIVEIRNALKLTSLGKLYFDSSQPAVESADGFNQNCPQSEPNNPVVGCYSNQLIYVYDVKDNRLDGIEETTAAHELLHAAYERMSDIERDEINTALDKAYKSIKTKELETRMEYYRKNEPGEEYNELHSILGTEFTQIGSTLEAHYAKYFEDRGAVLTWYQNYQSVFVQTTKKLDTLAVSINKRTAKVNAKITAFKRDQASLNADIAAFERRRFTSQQEFDAERAALLSRQDALNARVLPLKNEVAAIEKLRKEYNTVREEYEGLSRSINSSLEPAPVLNG